MSKTYKLTSSFFKRFQNRYYFVAIPFIIFLFLAMFLILVIGTEIRFGTVAISLILLFVVLLSLHKSIDQQKKIWNSYSLLVDSDSIRRFQDASAPIEISRTEISRIRDYPDGNIYVESEISKKGILIPSAIEDYSELRTLLTKWHEFEVSKSNRKLNIALALLVAVFVSIVMRIFYTGENETISIIIGIALLFIFIGVAIYAYNRSVDKRAKRALWWFLLPILGIALCLYTLFVSR